MRHCAHVFCSDPSLTMCTRGAHRRVNIALRGGAYHGEKRTANLHTGLLFSSGLRGYTLNIKTKTMALNPQGELQAEETTRSGNRKEELSVFPDSVRVDRSLHLNTAIETHTYCWYAMTVKEDVVSELLRLSTRTERAERAINYKARGGGREFATDVETAVPILKERRKGKLHLQLLSCLQRCPYVATAYGLGAHPQRRSRPRREIKRKQKRKAIWRRAPYSTLGEAGSQYTTCRTN